MTTKKEQYDYINQHKRENYDRIGLLVPKGMKTEIQKYAKKLGLSVNGFIYDAIKAKLNEVAKIEPK